MCRRRTITTLMIGSLSFFTIPAPAASPPDKPATALIENGPELLKRVQAALAELVERVGPAAVAIQCNRDPAALGDRNDSLPRAWVSTGSGVIIRDDGMILTSQHVIDGAVGIHVVLHDGRRVRARLIAADRRSDLAIIRIAAGNLKSASLVDGATLRRGHIVLALGNPLGLSSDGQAAVSHGLISAIGRPLPEAFGREEDRYYGDMIQTTAPIHPGNSGGPLIDIQGRVVGVITATSTRADGHEGIGFAVPIDTHTRAIIDKLLRGEPIEYGYMDVKVARLPRNTKPPIGLSPGEGVLIHSVYPGGPAEQAGLRGGDIVTAVDDTSITSVEQFVRTIGAAGPGTTVSLVYVRMGEKNNTEITLTRRPTTTTQELPDVAMDFRGATLGRVTPMMRLMANLPENALLVLRVDADSPSDRAGLAPGDVIARVNGKPVTRESISLLAKAPHDLMLGLTNGDTVLVKKQ